MSKAFTRENDELEVEATFPRSSLPVGTPNYMTADGAERLRQCLASLAESRSHQEGEVLRRTNGRMHAISQKLTEADVVSISQEQGNEVRFGCYVTVRDGDGNDDEYRIVGVDEVDLDPDWISWRSPLAQALLGRKVGELVRFRAPAGERELRIVRVRSSGP
jgi:transcription elongation factor GreB